MRKQFQSNPSSFKRDLLRKLEKRVQFNRIHSQNSEKYFKQFNFQDGSIRKYSKMLKRKSEHSNILYNTNNVELSSDKDRANAFADYFASMSSVFNDLGSASFTKKVSNKVKKFRKEKVDINEVVFATFKEVVKTIKTLEVNKATGHDMISPRVIKNFPQKAIVFIVKLINGVFCSSHFPEAWEISKVIPLVNRAKTSHNFLAIDL